jgi:trigger factor
VQAHVDQTLHGALHGLDHDEQNLAEALEAQGSSREEFDADARNNAEKAVKTQLLVDAIADELNIRVGQEDITERLVLQSRQYGVEPQQLLQFMQENNQLPVLFADVRRGKALAAVVHQATVTDSDGNIVDTEEFFGERGERVAAADNEADTEESDEESDTD